MAVSAAHLQAWGMNEASQISRRSSCRALISSIFASIGVLIIEDILASNAIELRVVSRQRRREMCGIVDSR